MVGENFIKKLFDMINKNLYLNLYSIIFIFNKFYVGSY